MTLERSRTQPGLRGASHLLRLALGIAVTLVAACARPPLPQPPEAEPFRLSQTAVDGDPARRASIELVLEGLRAESRGGASLALGRYQSAIQVDPGNPFAYLALARFHLDSGDASRATAFLDKAQALLAAEDAITPGLRVHLVGLRGAALRRLGRFTDAEPLLAEARSAAPAVWGDGRLAPEELF